MNYDHEPPMDQPVYDAAADTAAELDRDNLNRLVREASQPQALYGKDISLTDYDRQQLGLVASEGDAALESAYQDPAWNQLQELIREGNEKGALPPTIRMHENTNVPTWCIDDGEDAEVHKVRTDQGSPAIAVPSHIFNLYHWNRTTENIREIAGSSDELLHGRAAKPLGRDLRQMATLIGAPGDKTEEQA